MPQLVQIPIISSTEIFENNVELAFRKARRNSPLQDFYSHQPEQKSWDFLSEYVNNAQSRHEKMKAKIAEAVVVMKKLEDAAKLDREAELKKEELQKLEQQNKQQELEARKAAENNIYERPQAKAQADSFLEATKEIFAMSEIYDNSQDSNSKSFKMKMKLTINRRTGQITDSKKQIKEVVNELVRICFESRTNSKQAFAYCLVLLSNKLLAQAETQVSLHAPSAFPLAQVAVEISTNVVEFPSVLMSALIKRCCFAVPRYPKRNSSEEAFKIELGYLSADGIIKESDAAFIERMSGLISFYAAVVQTDSFTGKPNVIGLNMGWTWLATILNLPPRPITPYLIVSFLEQAAYSFYRKYGANFEKLVKFILEKYITLIPSSSIAAKTRLEMKCKELISSGQHRIKEPVGLKFSN